MKARDLIAFPFLLVSLACERIAIFIGSKWTAELVLGNYQDNLK